VVPARVTFVTLGTSDLKGQRKFYEALGWQATDASDDDYVQLKTAGAILSLFPLEELARDAALPELLEARGSGAVTLATNLDRKEDVDAAVLEIEAAGGRILKPAEDTFWGGRNAYFSDPEGNLWEVAWNPHLELDQRGAPLL